MGALKILLQFFWTILSYILRILEKIFTFIFFTFIYFFPLLFSKLFISLFPKYNLGLKFSRKEKLWKNASPYSAELDRHKLPF